MGYMLPSIMRRIDEFLLVKQLNAKILDHCVRDDLLMMATASPLAGNEYDYERLELLGRLENPKLRLNLTVISGDAFLKYLSSIYVFVQSPNGTEGELHTARQRYISNQQLCYAASRLGLPGYIQLKPFNIKSWIPPGMKLADVHKKESSAAAAGGPEDINATPRNTMPSRLNDSSAADPNTGKGSKGRKKRPKKTTPLSPIASKVDLRMRFPNESSNQSFQTVADVAEAIIGAAYISDGREAALKATKALMIPFVEIEEWSDFGRKARIPQPNANGSPDPFVIHSIEEIIGHRFRKPHLLALALVQYRVFID